MANLRTPDRLVRFLEPGPLIDFDAPEIATFADEYAHSVDQIEAAKRVFHFVRDEVQHSWDIQSHRVTRSATDVLTYREGICYAKSHLVAALLRRAGIPAGICYQRLTLLDDDSAGYAVHALNTVYLEPLGRWIRFDARGNKPGVDAQFSLTEERLAFHIRPEYDEVDYLVNYSEPHPAIGEALRNHDDAITMYRTGLPSTLM